MNMSVDTVENLGSTRVYDQEFFNRLTRLSETTNIYLLAKKELNDLEFHEALDVFATKPENQPILRPFLEKLGAFRDNMYDLRERGELGEKMNAMFDVAMESLVRADWQKLQKDGADWNRVCAALTYGLTTTAELLGVRDEVNTHIEEWRQFYLKHGMSRSQQRELRGRLNAEALEHHKNLAYVSMHREKGGRPVQKTMNEIRGKLNVVQQRIDAMGADPDPRHAGAFTKAQLGERVGDQTNEYFVPQKHIVELAKMARQKEEKEIPSYPSMPTGPQPKSIYASYMKDRVKKDQEAKKVGFFGRMKKKVRGWLGL